MGKLVRSRTKIGKGWGLNQERVDDFRDFLGGGFNKYVWNFHPYLGLLTIGVSLNKAGY